jgi:uncharacterized RDD family membrane protein YckC
MLTDELILDIIIAVVCFALAIFWVIQFAQMMALSDKDFPGRNDKTLWLVAFLVFNVLTAFAFTFWRGIMVGIRSAQKGRPPS